MARDFDAEILASQKQLETATANMEQVAQKFIVATAQFLQQWYWSQVEAMVKKRSEITKKLDVEKRLSGFKAEVRQLQENCPQICKVILGNDNLWWHRALKEQAFGPKGNRPPGGLDEAIRLAAGNLASILEEYGYLSCAQQDAWREPRSTGHHHQSGARPYYPYGLQWSEEMRNVLQTYSSLKQEGEKLIADIASLRSAKEKSEAEDLWGRA